MKKRSMVSFKNELKIGNSFVQFKRRNKSGFDFHPIGKQQSSLSYQRNNSGSINDNLIKRTKLYKKFVHRKLANQVEKDEPGVETKKRTHRKSKTMTIETKLKDKLMQDMPMKKPRHAFQGIKKAPVFSSRARNLSNKAREPNMSSSLRINDKNSSKVRQLRKDSSQELANGEVETKILRKFRTNVSYKMLKRHKQGNSRSSRTPVSTSFGSRLRKASSISNLKEKMIKSHEFKFNKLKLSKKGKLKHKRFFNLLKISKNEHKLPKIDKSKVINKEFGLVKSFAVNTHVGNFRDYNEDRVSILLNAQQRYQKNKIIFKIFEFESTRSRPMFDVCRLRRPWG